MNQIRLIRDQNRSGALNLGIDEGLLEGMIAGTSVPTLRFYSWSPPTVSLGYFQSIEEEINLEKLCSYGMQALRRPTGGGAVLHEHEVTYSLVIPAGWGGVPEGVLPSYQFICQGIIKGLGCLGLEAEFVPLNDIVVEGKKVSGNAQTRRGGVVLQHGTVLLEVDVDKMFSLLRVSREKLRDKMIQSARDRVTGLRNLLGRPIGFDEVANALTSGFGHALGCQLVEGQLTRQEIQRAEKLAQHKYSSDSWNHRR